MKEILELRINYEYAHLLFKADEGKNIGTSVKVIELSIEDPRYRQVPIIAKEVKKKYDKNFFFGWQIKRKYSKKELDAASLLHMKIKVIFEPTGEECGTIYDESVACEICGANRKQVSSLILIKEAIPQKDIAKTIGGEIIVSEKFVNAVKRRNLKGLIFSRINLEKYYQLTANMEIELSPSTVVGINPFDLSSINESPGVIELEGYSINFEKEIYTCPKGDTIGLNLLSEPHVLINSSIDTCDFLASRQKIGVKRGLLRPESIHFCSQAFKQMVGEENLTGFDFEITRL